MKHPILNDFRTLQPALQALALDVFGSQKAAEQWFTQPQLMLNDRVPFEMVVAGETDVIQQYLERVHHGVY